MSKDIYKNGMYYELAVLATKLNPWFDIDKIRSHSVYVWSKDSDEDTFDGVNVFDIYPDYIQFYPCAYPWTMPAEAIPVIMDIQEKLKEIKEFTNEKL